MTKINLNPKLQDFVRNEVASGRFRTENEVLSEAVRLLRSREIYRLRQEILVGVEQLERGEGIVVDGDEELAAFFDEIMKEGDREFGE